jgi:hypothetical protein
MAITKTTTFKKAGVYPPVDATAASSTNAGNNEIEVFETIVLSDSSDSSFPIEQSTKRRVFRYVEDGGAATDVSSEHALVKSIAGAIWS